MLNAYFDESRRENGLLCVAGFAFAERPLKELTLGLDLLFGRFGGLHMREMVHRQGRYKGISEKERDRLMQSATRLIARNFSYGVAVTINESEYLAQAPRFIRGFGSPYAFLCHLAMVATARIATKHGYLGLINYVYESGHLEEAEGKFVAGQALLSPEVLVSLKYGGHQFLSKQQAVALQTADFFAWEIAKFQAETVDNPIRRMRRSLQEVLSTDTSRIHVSFCQGTALTRALSKFRNLGWDQIREQRLARVIDTLSATLNASCPS